MSNKQSAKIVVVRCADLVTPAPDSAVRQCGTCGADCWASASTVPLESKYDVTYSCQVCTPPAELLNGNKRVGVLESQRTELEATLGTWGAAALLARLGIKEIEPDES